MSKTYDRSTISWGDLSKEEIEEEIGELGYDSISAYVRDLVKGEAPDLGGVWSEE
jgi:hypothetical protein